MDASNNRDMRDTPNHEGYRVHIKQFEGPLDLLLYLIEKAEVDIRDIFISDITTEFLKYMSELDELDMEQASSFLTVAATLLYMKSRSLIPKVKTEEPEAEEDAGELLIRQLREYKAFKQASADMRALYDEAVALRSRPPTEFPVPPREIILKDTTAEGLYHAFLSALNRLPEEEKAEPIRKVVADRYTIRSCATNIRERLRVSNGEIMFLDIMRGREKLCVIVTFMALLEMLRRGEVGIRQEERFGDIAIREIQLVADDEDIDYEDEI